MNYEELEGQLLKEFKACWTDWLPDDFNKMKKKENKNSKELLRLLISKAFCAGLERAKEISKEVLEKVG